MTKFRACCVPTHWSDAPYRTDIWRHTLDPATDRRLAESYIRLCTELEKIDNVTDFAVRFPEASRAYRNLNEPCDEAAERIFKLYKRHASQINCALDRMSAELAPELRRGTIPPYSLGGILFMGNVSYERDRAPALASASASARSTTTHDGAPGRKRRRAKSPNATETPIRPVAAANMAKVVAAVKAHIKTAKDHADETGARGEAKLLPRPTQEQLAKLAEVHPSTVSRCLRHKDGGVLRLLWRTANDLQEIMRHKF
ncbi:hypothetical protein ACERK3_07115 [Phycisphaerales bacterium AB-hyl4]|uniref:Uncharacterized protein n=1 Tax=Natronomicrosphaera hydrolytica TaxID=3242702 RepID=A0ABV4U394_9BACT